MVKEIILTFSDKSYQTLEEMAKEVGCPTDQLIREALGWCYGIKGGMEHDPHGRLVYMARNSYIRIDLVSDSAFGRYIERLRRQIPEEEPNACKGRTCLEIDPSKMFRPTD